MGDGADHMMKADLVHQFVYIRLRGSPFTAFRQNNSQYGSSRSSENCYGKEVANIGQHFRIPEKTNQ